MLHTTWTYHYICCACLHVAHNMDISLYMLCMLIWYDWLEGEQGSSRAGGVENIAGDVAGVNSYYMSVIYYC